ncbi:MAG TPA: hypothetical protein VGL86_22675, partial [Polyangia bacterium]
MAIAIALACATAHADMPPRLVVAGQGECPTAKALARALERLHPALRAQVDAGEGARVEVVDSGGSYEVRAGGGVRRLEDAARRCAERATAAALAVTLLIAPPMAPPPAAVEAAPDASDGPLAPRATPIAAPTKPPAAVAPTPAVAPARA